jgi:hypothetical protein
MFKWLKISWHWTTKNPNEAIWPVNFDAKDVLKAIEKSKKITDLPHVTEEKPKPALKKATTRSKTVATKPGLYANIHAKQKRIEKEKAEGNPVEKMRKPGTKGAPTAAAFKQSAKTAKKK